MNKIDIGGNKGHNGAHGNNGHCHGEDGGAAGHAQAGGKGGQAFLRLLRVENVPTAVHVTGTLNSVAFSQVFNLGTSDLLTIIATGGAGGHGGDGGSGKEGHEGHHGMNAT